MGEKSIEDIIMDLSQRNPGALRVISEIIKFFPEERINILFELYALNIKGSLIRMGYKDICNHDLKLYVEKIKSKDKEMINYLNKYSVTME